MESYSDMIRRDSAAYAALYQQMRAAFARRCESKDATQQWKDAAKRWNEFASPMFLLWKPEVQERIAAEDPEAVEKAICFLEVDPFHFRSGYLKSKLIQRLKRIHLTARQQGRLRSVVLQVLISRHKRAGLNHYARLAAAVQTPDFIAAVEELRHSENDSARWRARSLLPVMHHCIRSSQTKH